MNLITIMLDSLRPDFIHCYGRDEMQTPAMDRLASEGAFFANAYAEAPTTIPARTARELSRKLWDFGQNWANSLAWRDHPKGWESANSHQPSAISDQGPDHDTQTILERIRRLRLPETVPG